jgi:LPXTG-motif cell wall-anchored protein
MNNKTILIGGVLALLGAGAYMFFKNKKKTTESKNLTPSDAPILAVASSTPTPLLAVGTIVTSTTASPNPEEQSKLESAKNIEAKIKNYYQKSALRSKTSERLFKTSGIGGNPYPLLINNLKKELAPLGYEYKGGADGFLIKI